MSTVLLDTTVVSLLQPKKKQQDVQRAIRTSYALSNSRAQLLDCGAVVILGRREQLGIVNDNGGIDCATRRSRSSFFAKLSFCFFRQRRKKTTHVSQSGFARLSVL
jgi:hypothetical protein